MALLKCHFYPNVNDYTIATVYILLKDILDSKHAIGEKSFLVNTAQLQYSARKKLIHSNPIHRLFFGVIDYVKMLARQHRIM